MYWREIIERMGDKEWRMAQLYRMLEQQPNKKIKSTVLVTELKLSKKSGDRQIRELVTRLCEKGIPVLGDHEGVWLSTDPATIVEYTNRRENEIKAAYRTATLRLDSLRSAAKNIEVRAHA